MKKRNFTAITLALLTTLNMLFITPKPVSAETQTLIASDIVGGGVVYTYDKATQTVTFSKTLKGDGITYRYAESPFTDTDIETVIVNEGVIGLEMNLFYQCKKLKNVTLPKSLTLIGRSTFENCTALTNITIPNRVKSIGYRAFYGCTKLKSIVIPSSVTELGSYVFQQCKALTDITIGSGLTTLSHGVFQDCTALTKITIPSNITTLSGCVFQDCTGLKSIVIPDTVTTIDTRTFWGCISLQSVKLPKDLQSIVPYMFNECKSLKTIDIPESVKEIGEYAFNQCSTLTDLIIPSGVEKIGRSAFGDCTAINTLDFSANAITALPESVFYNCANMEKIILPASVTSIGRGAFAKNSSLQEIVIPEAVKTIGEKAFLSCSENLVKKFIASDLSDVTIKAENDIGTDMVGWKAVTLRDKTTTDDGAFEISLTVDEANPISELKYAVGEKEKAYFQDAGEMITDRTISVPAETYMITLYSKDIGGNETVNVCTLLDADLLTASEIVYGQTLENSILTYASDIAGRWRWADASETPNAGISEHEAVFIPSSKADTLRVTVLVSVTVRKATPEIQDEGLPIAGDILFGQSLADSVLKNQ